MAAELARLDFTGKFSSQLQDGVSKSRAFNHQGNVKFKDAAITKLGAEPREYKATPHREAPAPSKNAQDHWHDYMTSIRHFAPAYS
jgi:hypothetical protein